MEPMETPPLKAKDDEAYKYNKFYQEAMKADEEEGERIEKIHRTGKWID